MDDAPLVRVLHRVAGVSEELDLLAQPAPARPGVERLAVDELHRDEGLVAALGIARAGLVDLRDARMVEPAEDVRLLLEAPQQLPRRRAAADRLERDAPAREGLLGFVDDAHAAFADAAQDPVLAREHGRPRLGEAQVVRVHLARADARQRVEPAADGHRRRAARVRREHRLELARELGIRRAQLVEARRAERELEAHELLEALEHEPHALSARSRPLRLHPLGHASRSTIPGKLRVRQATSALAPARDRRRDGSDLTSALRGGQELRVGGLWSREAATLGRVETTRCARLSSARR